MNIRPVKTERDYDAALKRIEELWSSEPETPEYDELDVLITLVGVYEDENHPVPPPSPIEAIKFVMDQRGLKQADLVEFIGSRPRVSEILSGKRSLTLSMIRSLHEGLGIPAEILIADGSSLPKGGEAVDWNSFPVREIVKRGWVSSDFDYKTQAEEIMRNLITHAGFADDYSLDTTACFRQGSYRRAKADPKAVQTWLLAARAMAKKVKCQVVYKKDEIDQSFISKVAHLSVLKDAPRFAQEYLLSKGIKLVIVEKLDRTHLDGAIMIEPSGTPVIALSLRYDRLDNFWFTLAHELAHLVLCHVYRTEGQCIVDDLESISSSKDEHEKEASSVATEALIPSESWASHPARLTANIKDVRELARKADIHQSIVAGRIRFERNNYSLLSRHVGQGQVRKLFSPKRRSQD